MKVIGHAVDEWDFGSMKRLMKETA